MATKIPLLILFHTITALEYPEALYDGAMSYIFGYPLVLANVTAGHTGFGTNKLELFQNFVDPSDHDFVNPNVDTLYA